MKGLKEVKSGYADFYIGGKYYRRTAKGLLSSVEKRRRIVESKTAADLIKLMLSDAGYSHSYRSKWAALAFWRRFK